MKKNYLCFNFFVFSYYLYIERRNNIYINRYIDICRYVDIQIPIDGAEGLRAVGLMGLTTIKNKYNAKY